MAEPILSVRGLELHFKTDRGDTRLFEGLDLDVGRGEALGVVGESGSGKTTLAHAVLRLLPSNAVVGGGTILLNGRDLSSLSEKEMRMVRGKEVTMVFQDPSTALNPAYRIKGQMLKVIKANARLEGTAALGHAMALLKSVELPDPASVLESFPFELSGGMQQRVMIAMALTSSPKLVIADEPTSAVDATIQTQILRLLERLRRERGFSVMFITHSIAVAREVSDRIAVMYAGDIVEEGAADSVVDRPKHPYTEGLVKCIPSPRKPNAVRTDLPTVPGQVPDLTAPPTGCRFHPRCPYVMDVCSRSKPPNYRADGNLALCHLYGKER